MPNYCNNSFVIIGSENDIKNFLKTALDNLKVDTSSVEDTAEAYLNTCLATKKLSLQSFTPVPEDFQYDVDTTNHPEKYPEVADYQNEHYGVVGWYDYNIKYLGCKWDCEMDTVRLHRTDEFVELTGFFESPWTNPNQWFLRVSKLFPELTFANQAIEEGCLIFTCTVYKNGEITYYNDYYSEVEELGKTLDYDDEESVSDFEERFQELEETSYKEMIDNL